MIFVAVHTFLVLVASCSIMVGLGTPSTNGFGVPASFFCVAELLAVNASERIWDELVHYLVVPVGYLQERR